MSENWVKDWLFEVQTAACALEIKKRSIELMKNKALSLGSMPNTTPVASSTKPDTKADLIAAYVDAEEFFTQDIEHAALTLIEFDLAMQNLRSSLKRDILLGSYILEYQYRQSLSLKEITKILGISMSVVGAKKRAVIDYLTYIGPVAVGVHLAEPDEQKAKRLRPLLDTIK